MVSTQLARAKPAAALVKGGGIGGCARRSISQMLVGLKAYLVEYTPCLGGRVAQLGFMVTVQPVIVCDSNPLLKVGPDAHWFCDMLRLEMVVVTVRCRYASRIW